MDQDDRTTYQVHLNAMLTSCQKKIIVLQKILEISMKQELIIQESQIDDELFQQTLTEKEALIEQINELDEGFQIVYEHVKNEIERYQSSCKEEIQSLKDCIVEITDLSVMIEATEKRNKERLQVHLSNKRQEIKQKRLSSKSAYGYYKSVNNQVNGTPFFYDKKN